MYKIIDDIAICWLWPVFITLKIGVHKVGTLPLTMFKLQDYTIHVQGQQNKHYLMIEDYIPNNWIQTIQMKDIVIF